MKLKTLAAATVIAFCSIGANAGSASFADGVAYIANDQFSATGLFAQSITLSGLTNGTYEIFGTLTGNLLSFSSVVLDGNVWEMTNYVNKGKLFSFGYLDVTGSTPLTLSLSGTNQVLNSSYTGSISVTPVPEPESYAMLLAGLGVMGAIARRRNKADSAV